MTHILKLPTELHIEIFSNLYFPDIFACQRTCRTFLDVISESPALNYLVVLQKAGLKDNPQCTIPLLSRLQMLRERELAWASLDLKSVQDIPVPSGPPMLYELAPGILIFSEQDEDGQTRGFHYVRLPGPNREALIIPNIMGNFLPGKSIADFKPTIMDSGDFIIACIVLTDDGPSTSRVAVELTRIPQHPESGEATVKYPPLDLFRATDDAELDYVCIDICGRHLAVVATAEDLGGLFIFDWQTGDRKTVRLLQSSDPLPAHNSDVVFIRENILVNPNVLTNNIDIYLIPENQKPVHHFYSLDLPEFLSEYVFCEAKCRIQPGPTSRPDPNRPYFEDPMNAILAFTFEYFNGTDDDTEPPSRYFIMVIHRYALLDIIGWRTAQSEESFLSGSIARSYDTWGPPETRWFETERTCTDYVPNHFGQRLLLLKNPPGYQGVSDIPDDEENMGPQNTIHVLDFNPARVRDMANRIDGYNASLSVRVVGAESARMAEFPRQRSYNSDKAENVLLGVQDIFRYPIRGSLPFSETVLVGFPEYRYDGILMEEERIIALKRDFEGVSSIYLG